MDLRRGGSQPEVLPRAYRQLKRIMWTQMSARQRMLTFYALAMLLISSGELADGMQLILDAMRIAEQLEDRRAWAELAHAAGTAERAGNHFESAADLLSASLEELRELASDGGPADPELEFSNLVLLSVAHFTAEEHQRALAELAEAERLLPAVTNHEMKQATIDWARAGVLRASRAPDQAFPLVLRAADVYAQATTPASRMAYARIQGVVAEIVMDIAETLSPAALAPGRAAMLEFARPYIARAVELADPTCDPEGEVTALLARVRFDLLRGQPADILGALDVGLARSKQLGDAALLAQTYTAYGEAFARRGDEETALNFYRRVLDTIGNGDMQVMAARARRALVEASLRR